MSNALSQFMSEVGKYDLMTVTDERLQFQKLAALNDQLVCTMNQTAIFYNKIPSILGLLSEGYEAVKNIIQPHKHDLKTKELTQHVITTLQTYQTLYQQKVIQKKPELKLELDNLTIGLAFDPAYITELANEVRMYDAGDSLVDMHVVPSAFEDIQVKIAQDLFQINQISNYVIACNLRLVVNIARKFTHDGMAAQIDDLIQEGNIGLMKAVERYDVTTGNRFSTVATWWIRQSIIRSLQNGSRMIRVPVNVQDHLSKALSMQQKLEKQYKRPATTSEMASALGITLERYKELTDAITHMTSLDAPAGNDEDSNLTLADVIADIALSADMEIYSEQMQKMVTDALEKLTEREREVIKMRYGFEDAEMSLGECAAVLGVSKPSIMNYESRALLKLHRLLCENQNSQ